MRTKVNAGMYTSASEVVREALRLMDEQDRLRQIKLDDLRREVRTGLDSGAIERWDATSVKANARRSLSAKLAKPYMTTVLRRLGSQASGLCPLGATGRFSR